MSQDAKQLVISATDAFLAYQIAYLDDIGLLDWADEHARSNLDLDSESSLFRLLWLNRKTARLDSRVSPLIESYALECDSVFDVRGPSAEVIAQRLFESRLLDYLDEKCRPWDVCRMVSPIEQLFDYPSWLGDMFNQCDWIEPEFRPVDCRHLEHGIKQHLDRTGE